MKGSITLPVENESEIRYWIHPADYTQNVSVEKNTLYLRTGEIPSYRWYEISVVFPRIESPNSSIVQIDNSEGFEEIMAIENEYQRKVSILNSLYGLFFITMVSEV